MNRNTNSKDNKNVSILIRVTPDEKADLINQSVKNGYNNLSEYLRDVGLKKKIIPKTDVEMIEQIRKIGVNINQIAHSFNINFDIIFAEQRMNELKQYIQIFKDIVSKLRE